MIVNRMNATLTRRTVAAAAAAAALALTAGSAAAAPPEDIPLGEYTCEDGTTIAPTAKAVPGFYRPDTVGFVDGRAVAPRWFTGKEAGTITITSGPYAGDELPFDVDWSEPAHGQPKAAPTLHTLVECSSGLQEMEFTLTLDEVGIAETGLDPKYLGAEATVESTGVFSVFLKPTQLSHR